MISKEALEIKNSFNKYTEFEKSKLIPLPKKRKLWEDNIPDKKFKTLNYTRNDFKENVFLEIITPKNYKANFGFLYIHGGGFTQGSAKTHRNYCSILSSKAKIEVYNTNYSLAPEEQFPTALLELYKMYTWIYENKCQNIIVGGDSAGGNLALSLCLKINMEHFYLPKGIILLSPWLDLTLSDPRLDEKDQFDPMVLKEDLAQDVEYYCPGLDLTDPFISPLLGNFKRLPPTFIQVGENEILLSDSERLEERMNKYGVDVTLQVWDEMWHAWQHWYDDVPEAKNATRDIIGFIDNVRSKMLEASS